MGCSIAANIAASGTPVILVEISNQAVDSARRRIVAECDMARMFGGGAYAAPDIGDRITYAVDPAELQDTWFIIESVTEDVETKKRLIADVAGRGDPGIVIASNTSVLPLATLGAGIRNPSRLVGIHFMNPVTLKKWVEVIRTAATPEEVLETVFRLLRLMGKKWTVVNDSPGFVSNRVLMLMINEAIGLVERSVATPRGVDEIFRHCMAHKMGPLETADLIGLDTIRHSLIGLRSETGDAKFTPCPLLDRHVASGRLGRKSGAGFYEYGTNLSSL